MTQALQFDKNKFFQHIGYGPHAGQIPIHASDARIRVVACGVRFGKTVCAAMELLAAAMSAQGNAVLWVVAPTYDLASRVFNHVQRVVREKFRRRVTKNSRTEMCIEIRNMSGGTSVICGKSADNPDSLLGEGVHFMVVDEAARLRPSIWEDHLTQRLLDTRGRALLISTPHGRNYFYELWRLGQGKDSQYESWNLPSSTNPMLPLEDIELQRSRLSARTFRTEFEAAFIEGEGSVFHNVRELATGTFQDPRPRERYFAGLDLARTRDYTVLVIMNERYEVVYCDRFRDLDWEFQYNRIQGAVARYRGVSILMDNTGAGQPSFEAMQRRGLNVDGYTLTHQSKAALISRLNILFELKKVRLPSPTLWSDGIEELEAFQYTVSDHGNVTTGAPYGKHDDIVIALALAAWNTHRGYQGLQIRRCNSWAEVQRALNPRRDC